MISYLESLNIGHEHHTYKLRDWVFSRQRYWGEPFPVLYDEDGGIHLLEDDELPLTLPELNYIKPSGTGESPLVHATDWLEVTLPNGKKARRDTNTMPQLAGSSWYYIGYILKTNLGFIPLDSEEAKQVLDQFLPVDLYVGGTEHAVGHLLYARFWHKVFYDLGIVSSKEPFQKLVNQGMILGEDHQKMSKSRGNTVSPDDIFQSHGADALRVYEMFMGPLEQEKPWSTEGLDGSKRFLDRFFRMFEFEILDEDVKELQTIFHQTVKKVTEDYEKLAFNTAIAQMMIFVNEVYKIQKIGKKQARDILKLLNPIAPHITEEINQTILSHHEELIYSTWPTYDPKYLIEDEAEIVVQVNGKVRAKMTISRNLPEEEVKNLALQQPNVMKHIEGMEIVKMIVVANKIVNIVVK
jgi:leucyl-tRNA synthetase